MSRIAAGCAALFLACVAQAAPAPDDFPRFVVPGHEGEMDLMARLITDGPDDAWERLNEIVTWFDETQAAGGYRAYYSDPARGTMQGGNVAGGLGLDKEFFESILAPQVMLYGFLGFQPNADGFAIHPRLPKEWPELTITRIRLHGCVLDINARDNTVTVTGSGRANEQLVAALPPGWQLSSSSSGFVTGK